MKDRAAAGTLRLLGAIATLALARDAAARWHGPCQTPATTCSVPTAAWTGTSAEAWPANGQPQPPVGPTPTPGPLASFVLTPSLTLDQHIDTNQQLATTVVVSWGSDGTRPLASDTGALAVTAAYPPVFDPPATTFASCDDDESMSAALVHRHAVRLEGLAPSTRFYYRAVDCTTGAFVDGTFVTPGGATFRIAHFGEFHAPPPPHVGDGAGDFRKAVSDWKPELIIDSGDMMDSTAPTSLAAYTWESVTWLPNVFLLPTTSNRVPWNFSGDKVRIPNFFTLPDLNGCAGCGSSTGCPLDCLALAPSDAANPANPSQQCPTASSNLIEFGHKPWYATRYGDVLVITLADLSTKPTHCENSEQRLWLKRELERAHDSSAPSPPTFILFAYHEPSTAATPVRAATPFVQTILENGGGDLLLTGHLRSNSVSAYQSTSLLQIESDLRYGAASTSRSAVCDPAARGVAGRKVGPRFAAMSVEDVPGGRALTSRFQDQDGSPSCCFRIIKVAGTRQVCTCGIEGWKPSSPFAPCSG